MKRGFYGLAAGLLVGSLARPASAEGKSVRLELPACEALSFDAVELLRLAALEFGAEGWTFLAPSTRESADSSVTLEVEPCSTDEYEIGVAIQSSGPAVRAVSITTRLSLHDVPYESRARTLAVAIAELLRVARRAPPPDITAEPTAEPSPPVPPAPVVAALEPAQQPPEESTWSAEAQASARGLAGEMPAFLGGGLGLSWRIGDRGSLRAGLDAEYSSGRVRWGRLEVTALSVALGADLTLLGRPRITLGPAARWLTLLGQGQSSQGVPERLDANWAATLSGRLALEATIDESLELVLSGELGGYLRELIFTGVSVPIASFSGFTGGLTVGLAYDL